MAWARAVKARRRAGRVPEPGSLPALWLFTDPSRADPCAIARRLPPGLCGVVLRHDREPGRAALGRAVARICRARRILLLVAGDARLARELGAGLHCRRGRRGLIGPGSGRLLSVSAHDRAELVRARRSGARLAFLSPIFPTASHPGAPALGPARWAALARAAGMPVAALGGIGANRLRSVPRGAAGLAAMRAFEA